jgi:hypothetical protein
MLGSGDLIFETIWPGNTTPQAPDGAGNVPRNLCGYTIVNTAAAARYVKLFNKATAPTMGTDTPAMVIPLAAGTTVHLSFSRPPLFALGLWVSTTTGISNSDNTAPAASDILMNLLYA